MADLGETLVIIPARGGSKRLPRKNVLRLGGKPLICWTIEAVLEAKLNARIMVTSEDEEILAIARQYETQGIMLHRRTAALATDEVATIDVILNVIEAQEIGGVSVKTVILLQPTSPLRTARDIQDAIALYYAGCEQKTVVSVCEVDHPTAWVGTLNSIGELQRVDFSGKRSQDYQKEYRLNGAVYVAPVDVLKKKKTLFTQDVMTVVMPRYRSWDVDDFMDFKICEVIVGCYEFFDNE